MDDCRSIVLETACSLSKSLAALEEHDETITLQQTQTFEQDLVKIAAGKASVECRMQLLHDAKTQLIAVGAKYQPKGEVKEMLEGVLEHVDALQMDYDITSDYLKETEGQLNDILQLMKQIDEAQQSIEMMREDRMVLMEELRQKGETMDMSHGDLEE